MVYLAAGSAYHSKEMEAVVAAGKVLRAASGSEYIAPVAVVVVLLVLGLAFLDQYLLGRHPDRLLDVEEHLVADLQIGPSYLHQMQGPGVA